MQDYPRQLGGEEGIEGSELLYTGGNNKVVRVE